MTTPPRNPSTIPLIVAAAVAIVLGIGTLVLALINPYALIGLGPVLLALAAIVRAVTGTRNADR